MNQNRGGPRDRAPRPDKLSPLGSGGAEGAAAELADGEHALGLALDLADALAGDTELVGELGEGGHALVAEAVAPVQSEPVAFREPFDGLLQARGLDLAYHLAGGVRGALVGDELPHLGAVGLRTCGLVEAGGVPQRALQVAHLIYGPLQLLRDLLVGRLPLELHRELVKGPGHLADLVAPMNRHPYGAALVGDGPLHGLPYPPRRVRREPPPALRVELLDGLHQADVALLDQVLERQPLPAVLLGYAHH